MGDEEFDESGRFGAVRCHPGECGGASFSRALVGLLIRVELSVNKEAVLKVVDAELRGFRIGDRAEMTGYLQVKGMRSLNGGPEFGAGDMHVRLEVGGAGGGPEIDEGSGVVSASQGMHLYEDVAGTLEIRRGRFDMWSDKATSVNEVTKVDVGIGLDGAGGSNCGDTVCEVHARSRKGHLREQCGTFGTGSVGVGALEVVNVVVHADEAGEDGIASEVEDLCVDRCGDVMADAGDPNAVDDDGLVLEDRCTRAINNANVLQDFYRRVLAIEIFGTDGARRGLLCECNRGRKSKRKK
jgi:hypothetical protein